MGRLVVFLKGLLRPVVEVPQRDLWERQRVFNEIVVEKLQSMAEREDSLARRLQALEARMQGLEEKMHEGLDEVMAHNDALFSLVDQKLDRYRRDVSRASSQLQAALAAVEPAVALRQAWQEEEYWQLEERLRGSEDELRARTHVYLDRLRDLDGPLLDLGCGRGEALAVFAEAGLAVCGVDASAEMVRASRERGLDVEQDDLVHYLAAVDEGSLGAVVCFHVIEHLPHDALARVAALALRALRAGGLLILETPSPLSLVAGSRNFWRDPTHLRPVHPESVANCLRAVGFEDVERLDLNPFAGEGLPEVAPSMAEAPPQLELLAHTVNVLRDRLESVLFGFQDYAILGRKPS